MEPQFLLLAKCYLSNEIKKNKMGKACGTHRKEVKHIGFGQKNLKARDHLKN
jgi:translation elongation factor EF-1beta